MSKLEVFSVGEIAILQNSVKHPEYNGVEITIMSPLTEFHSEEDGSWFGYETDLIIGYKILCPSPKYLKKLGPKDTVVSWSACIWQPEGVEV